MSTSMENKTTSTTSSILQIPVAKLASSTRFASSLRKEQQPKIVFPPPSWFIDDTQGLNEEEKGSQTDVPRTPEPPTTPGIEEKVPEPTTFAQKLRVLIDTLPFPASQNVSTTTSGEGPPVPETVDTELMRQLSSEDVMNGKGKGQSVWASLAGIKHTLSSFPKPPNSGASPAEGIDDETQGVMLYSPLEPHAGSQVELAETKPLARNANPPGEEESTSSGQVTRELSPEEKTTKSTPPTSSTSAAGAPKLQWVPSTTELSVQAFWWGYRIYLPPPVMDTLNSSRVKAAQRGTMITVALKWLLDHIPMVLVPAQFKPAVKVLQRLGPVLGYIGVFVAWSWAAVLKHDKGNGVVLTATWLMPVALIPMAWDAGDIYGPPPLPKGDSGEDTSSKGKADEKKKS